MTDLINTLAANPEQTAFYAKIAVVAISAGIAAALVYTVKKGI